MQRHDGRPLFSAGDLVAHLECAHATTLALQDLETPLARAEDDDTLKLIQDKGFAHEERFLRGLKDRGLRVFEVPDGNPSELAAQTLAAMREGHDVIFQAGLLSEREAGPFYGRADFLRRVEAPSKLGTWRYEPVDTKLARNPKAKFVVQLAFYSDLLAQAQGAEPRAMHLALGDGTERAYRVADFSKYFGQVKERYLAFTAAHPNDTYPERCSYCPFCPWREICEKRWLDDDHLNQVAGITRTHTQRLQAAGVRTLEALARVSKAHRLGPETLARLRSQAGLQLARRESGKPSFEVLPLDCLIDPSHRRGFHRLPQPDAGDVFFDMEGDPFEEARLEYLFGLRYLEAGEPRFQAFWAHDRDEERAAFEALMDFLSARLARHPNAHIYHYGHYEPTALKRLMSLHGTREAEVDGLLRRAKLVDLYKVVREALRTSEPGLSLKDIEVFYMPRREGEVLDAGASLVHYERWRATGDAAALEEIRRYNEDDCRSTHLLRDWLIGLRPAVPWFSLQAAAAEPDARPARVLEIEAELARYQEKLLGAHVPAGERELRELVFQLLDFHRRSAKPQWWALFARMDMTEDELIDDPECLGGLELARDVKPVPKGHSLVYAFRYPEQETKLRAGKECYRADTGERLGTLASLDEAERLVHIKTTKRVPARLSIGPGGPIDTEILRKALLRVADALIDGAERFPAVMALLRKDAPRLRGRLSGAPILPGKGELLDEALAAVLALESSTLFIQGPPGSGKTYTGSHLIVECLKRGKRVGVTSTSHKAINNLLHAVEKVAAEKRFTFSGVKKSTSTDPESRFDGRFIESLGDAAAAIAADAELFAGTAWFFAEPALEGALDYLFVDEAGQVSAANLVASGTSAKNIVLLGDQMQLGQPIQGVHPGRSGESTLEYLLEGLATIPPERGIFLPTTFRMHPDVCRFISEAVYDARLAPEPANQRQTLLLDSRAHPALRPTGIAFLPVEHDGNSQRSIEEAQLVAALYSSLLEQRFRDKRGRDARMGPDNILVVAPYNSQVNLLKSVLPAGARVGTIDKFQGQEAEAVLISMATSSGEHLPRYIEFLYDKNRLNVAISRARCLAIVVASPALLHINCKTPEQMALVNTLCWISTYGANAWALPPIPNAGATKARCGCGRGNSSRARSPVDGAGLRSIGLGDESWGKDEKPR